MNYKYTQPKEIKLIGGSRDGESIKVKPWQVVLYMPIRLSLEEMRQLKIDDKVRWKIPEEVYIRGDDGDFTFNKTIHYKPADFISNSSPLY